MLTLKMRRYVFNNMHRTKFTYTHTTILRLSGFCLGQPGWASTSYYSLHV